jgi:hypothetical protein
MGEGLVVKPEITAVVEHRKASSDCCGAKLRAADVPPEGFECTGCGEPCRRVLGEPQEVTARG